MKEDFLQFVWQFVQFNPHQLYSDNQESIQIIHQGILNHDSGPDFRDARIIIDGIEWAGNVEIHLYSSHWNDHKHQSDEAYNNVILQVVYENDLSVFDANGRQIPTVELKGRISQEAFSVYEKLNAQSSDIACSKQLHSIDSITIQQTLNRNLVDRLQRKTREIDLLCQRYDNHWEQILFNMLFRALGAKVNALPFSLLASDLPFSLIERIHKNQFEMEALLIGKAGFLDQTYEDDYPRMLKKEFDYQKQRMGLVSMSSSVWKQSRMRPNNFPILRLAQMSALMCHEPRPFRKILDQITYDNVLALLSGSSPHPYWQNHCHFDQPLTSRTASLGKSTINSLIINAVSPVLFHYGTRLNDQNIRDAAVNLLFNIPAENNSVVKKWKKLGIEVSSAADSQALLQLNNENCSRKKCVSCAIGTKLLLAS